ncbi:hypothetical protein KEM56_000403 [Ascosphaera pollenicola]|nr:hypothetical protein KEM56_000403 [Ascosphaera pollenicola]
MASNEKLSDIHETSRANSVESHANDNDNDSTLTDGSTLRRNLTVGTHRSALSRQATNRSNRSHRSGSHHIFVPSFPDNASVYQGESSEEEDEDGIEDEEVSGEAGVEDIEKGIPEKGHLSLQRTKSSRRSARDPRLITWSGPDDPENPKNWSSGKKWAAVCTVSDKKDLSYQEECWHSQPYLEWPFNVRQGPAEIEQSCDN